ncbi:hypothetical protein, partial [uncultured Acinetobacter sp.]|uniref:hypothetical protein n=1 Tax=uncultured Acinetobacter sp. TaxID=165433 RepID=UPI00262036EE
WSKNEFNCWNGELDALKLTFARDLFNIDQRVQNIINSFEHTSKLEVKDTYQELKQLAEDKKLNKNQFVFVVDATSPEAKVDKGSATFLYQVPDQKNQEKIEQALADLETLLAKNGDLEKEFRNLKADKYEEYVDLLKEKDAIRQYFFKLENGQEVYQPQVNLAENRLFDLDSAMKLIQVFGQSWEKFVKETISPVMDINKPGTASKINKLVSKLLENYSVLRDESAHRLIKVAEHESMDLKFEVKWGDIQDIPEPITKIITGQVLLQAVEW